MTTLTKQKPPFWFWIFAFIGLVWNGLGINQYLHQAFKTDYLQKMYPDPKVMEMIVNTPSWVMAAFATAVFFGFLGCLLLLFRKKWCIPFLIISFVAIIIQTVYEVFMSGAIDYFGPLGLILPTTIVVFSIVLLAFAGKSLKQCWIN